MDKHYTNNRAVQMLIYLLKANDIKKVIASPGTTNIEFVGSIENDPYFEIYSSVDERSAAYIACGLAEESGEPVVLSCTGATASRNYFPGLTEAYYRQLPVLAVTSTQPLNRTDCYSSQFIDRTVQPKDSVKLSVQIGQIHTDEDALSINRLLNQAILELNHRGKGPVHINLTTGYSKDFSVDTLPTTRVMHRIGYEDLFPEITAKKVGIYIGSHLPMSERLTKAIDQFCEKFNAVVLCDHNGNYKGRYCINGPLLCSQDLYKPECQKADLVIDIGNVSGAEMGFITNEVWRVNPDGVLRDRFGKLTNTFEMSEEYFFEHYTMMGKSTDTSYYLDWNREVQHVEEKGENAQLPFSNTWIAQQSISKLPQNSVLYLGVLNSIRNWDYFNLPKNVKCFANTGGFGIDGMISSVVGASLAAPNILHFGVLGDLSFFYDMNVVGNRHVGNNLRLLVINNGHGTEFTNYNHQGSLFGEDAERFIAAGGHFGRKSTDLIRHYAKDLGYEYYAADNKEDYLSQMEKFFNPKITHSMIFEVFTDAKNESDGIKIMRNLEHDSKGATKQAVKKILGESGVSTLKKILGK
jgi:2-succinyl-5-enolpyruvyl-6-hydroxy-3-cyclohexene-1-carboxylate synthase